MRTTKSDDREETLKLLLDLIHVSHLVATGGIATRFSKIKFK